MFRDSLMQAVKKRISWAVRQFGRSDPERLWLHYAVALLLIVGLFVASYQLNRDIVAESALAAQADTMARAQVLADIAILSLADRVANGRPSAVPALNAAIAQFRRTQTALTSSPLWSLGPAQHRGAEDLPWDQVIDAYMTMAGQLGARRAAQRPALLQEIIAYHEGNAIAQHLQITGELLALAASERAAQLAGLQRQLLTVSLLVVLGEVVLIFLPAQMTVRLSIAKLRNQTEVLKRSKRKVAEMNDRLAHLLNHDTLTGLPNRARVVDVISETLARPRKPKLGVLFVGLDGFKTLNDTAGHECGDGILRAVAQAFETCIDSEDVVARVGGDEFVLMTTEAPEALVKRLMTALAEPFAVSGRTLSVNASIGYVTSDRPDPDALSLIADAGIAMQAAKNAGGKRALAYTPDLRAETEMLQKLQLDLPEALAKGQIEPWFQPQVALASNTLHGTEVLARWRHPEHGLIPPDKFLPAAIRAGLMIEVDHALWQAALDHVSHWRTEGMTLPHVSLNAAPETISDPHLLERFLVLLHHSGLPAEQIVVEVLETTVIDGTDDMAAINIDSLSECGVQLELDDFGTGYASLSRLTQLPLSGIKLDRSLVTPLPDPAANSVIRAILALASELGLHVVAEGIEDDRQLDTLTANGCTIGQGFHFGRPMSADDFHHWLQDNLGAPQKLGMAEGSAIARA